MSSLMFYVLLGLCIVNSVCEKPNGLKLKIFINQGSFNLSQREFSQQKLVGPQVQRYGYYFLVQIGFGTFQINPPYKEYYLHVDTGSPLSWIQCEGSKRRFKQTTKLFPPKSSKSYRPILSSDELCSTKQSNGKYCSYKINYQDKSYTSGILAKETLTFGIQNKSRTKLENIVFGCGMDQNKMVYNKYYRNYIAGVLGLGWGPLSFANQMQSISNGMFSHCFPTILGSCKDCWTYLRFGANALPSKKHHAMTIPIHQIGERPFYYVDLDGISFNGRRLNLDPSIFKVKNNEGGVIINSWVIRSELIKPAYDVLEKELQSFFSKFKSVNRFRNKDQRICFKGVSDEFKSRLPTITFHFKGSGADLVMKPDALFDTIQIHDSVGKPTVETVCLGIFPNGKMTVIGAQQQINHRFTYDIKGKKLLFHQEDCKKNG